jgi:hypothetical protein
VRRNLVATAVLVLALPAAAQQSTLSLDQIERKYRGMSPVHIDKCDHDRDGSFTAAEQLCVASIYQQMYINRD